MKPDKAEYNKRYQKLHREELRQYKKAYYQANKLAARDYDLKKKYNISLEQFRQMHVAQNGRCAICLKPFRSDRDQCLDHDHSDGRVRQILCTKCNFILGHCNEDVLILERVIEYINKWKI